MMDIKTILQKVRDRKVLVIGDIMLDHYVWGDASRISPEAPVPVVDVTKDSYAAGGAANVALNVASLGGRAVLAGWTGNDEAGLKLDEILAKFSVQRLEGFVADDRTTIRKTRIMVRNQQLCRIDREGSLQDYSMEAESVITRLEEFLPAVDAVVFSDYGKGSITEALVERIAKGAAERGIPVSLDPKPRRRLQFSGLDLLTPNRAEALELAGFSPHLKGEFPAEEVCARIWENHRPKHLVITLGADGILISSNGTVEGIIPTFARQVFDVSGAGDTVIASLLLALSAGADLSLAARFANLAAGVVVGKVGTAVVTGAEISEYLARHPDLALGEGEHN